MREAKPPIPNGNDRLAYAYLAIKETCASALEQAAENFEDDGEKSWLQKKAAGVRRRALKDLRDGQ